MSNDLPFYAPGKKITPKVIDRRPREPLWTVVRHGSDRITAELVLMPIGVEVHLLRREEFYGSRRFDRRDQATAYAGVLKADLERDGWRVP